MHLRSLASLLVFVVACGGAAAHETVHVQAPVSAALPPAAAPRHVARPADVAVWVHVARPAALVPFATAQAMPRAPDAAPSCARGNFVACLDLAKASEPIDFAVTASPDGVAAVGFSVDSVPAFLAHAKKAFPAMADQGPSGVRLDEDTLCDVRDATPSLRVVCGTARGLAELGPWLRTSPLLETKGTLRGEVFAAPLVAAANRYLAGDESRDVVLRQMAHDFAGASFELSGGEAPTSPVVFDLDVKVRDAKSPWTRVLLTPGPASPIALPTTVGRLEKNATATVYSPGGGPVVAAVDRLAVFAAAMSGDASKVRALTHELDAVLARPFVYALALDFDEARAALTRAQNAKEKDRKKADEALAAAFTSYSVFGLEESVAAVRKLAERALALAPKTPGTRTTLGSGAALGLPRGSFVVESTEKAPAGAKKGAAPKTSTVLAVPDGDTTWVVAGDDARLTAKFVKRLLAQPKGALPGLEAPDGTVAVASLTSLLGAFSWDLAFHSYDALDKSLAESAPGRVRLALLRSGDATSGTVSLRLASDLPTLKALSRRLTPLAAILAVALAAGGGGAKSAP